LYGIRTILRAGRERLTERQHARVNTAINADPQHQEVHTAWEHAQQPATHTVTPTPPRHEQSPNKS
jgi:hypothetical protein